MRHSKFSNSCSIFINTKRYKSYIKDKKNKCKWFGFIKVVNQISFSVQKGERAIDYLKIKYKNKNIEEIFMSLVGISITLVLFPLISFILGKEVNQSTWVVQEEIKIIIEDSSNSKLVDFVKLKTWIRV